MDEHARTAKSSQMCGRVLLRNELGSVLSAFRNAGQKGAELAFHHLSRLKKQIMNNQTIQNMNAIILIDYLYVLRRNL